jgi:hypothetical protein
MSLPVRVAGGHGVWRSLVACFVRDEEVAGSNPVTPTCGVSGHRKPPNLRIAGSAVSFAGWEAAGLVVAAGVDGEFAEEFAGGGGHDADVEVVDERDDGGSGVGSADTDVVEAAVDVQG